MGVIGLGAALAAHPLSQCRGAPDPRDDGERVVNLKLIVYTQDVQLNKEGIRDADRSDLYQRQ